MKHWILTRDRLQTTVTNLDFGRTTLKFEKAYYSAYGVEIKGRTKQEFIRNLSALINGD
jgi:hypothetical protein